MTAAAAHDAATGSGSIGTTTGAQEPLAGRYPDLAGKRAFVTGGSAGIGRAVALTLAEQGVAVTIMARRQPRLDAVVANMKTPGFSVVGDVSNLDDCTRGVQEAIANMGGLDIVINNGGTMNDDMMKNLLEPSGFEAAFRLHVSSALACIKAAEAELIKNEGCVVNVSSMAAINVSPSPARHAYGVAKAAQDHLTKSMARYLAPHGVRINGVNPAWVLTEVISLAAGIVQKSEEEFLEAGAKLHALQRVSSAEEQAAVITFLCSRAAGFITGSCIKVDGGMALQNDGFPRFDQ